MSFTLFNCLSAEKRVSPKNLADANIIASGNFI